jgi:hypothetical protein
MRYIQHQLISLSTLLHTSPQPLIITITTSFTYEAIASPLTKPFYTSASYIDLLEQIQEGIKETMKEKEITKEQLYEHMKKIKVPKEEGKLY